MRTWTALTSAVARVGQQRILRRIVQLFNCALARSPGPRHAGVRGVDLLLSPGEPSAAAGVGVEPASAPRNADHRSGALVAGVGHHPHSGIVQGVEDSFRRLRRQVSLLTEEQLAAHDWWAASIVRGNSFGHYEEHLADLG